MAPIGLGAARAPRPVAAQPAALDRLAAALAISFAPSSTIPAGPRRASSSPTGNEYLVKCAEQAWRLPSREAPGGVERSTRQPDVSRREHRPGEPRGRKRDEPERGGAEGGLRGGKWRTGKHQHHAACQPDRKRTRRNRKRSLMRGPRPHFLLRCGARGLIDAFVTRADGPRPAHGRDRQASRGA